MYRKASVSVLWKALQARTIIPLVLFTGWQREPQVCTARALHKRNTRAAGASCRSPGAAEEPFENESWRVKKKSI